MDGRGSDAAGGHRTAWTVWGRQGWDGPGACGGVGAKRAWEVRTWHQQHSALSGTW